MATKNEYEAMSRTTGINSMIVSPENIYHQHVTSQIVIYGFHIRYNHAKMLTHEDKMGIKRNNTMVCTTMLK